MSDKIGSFMLIPPELLVFAGCPQLQSECRSWRPSGVKCRAEQPGLHHAPALSLARLFLPLQGSSGDHGEQSFAEAFVGLWRSCPAGGVGHGSLCGSHGWRDVAAEAPGEMLPCGDSHVPG